MTKIFIFDETGKQSSKNGDYTIHRRDTLISLLANKGVDAKLWDNALKLDSNCFVLAHKNDLSTYQETALIQSAESGATVVFYSGGKMLEPERTTKTKGHLYYLHWTSVLELLSYLPTSFELESVNRAFKAYKNRHLVNSLAILSSCASLPSGNLWISERQKEWQTTKIKWLEVFHGYDRNDLLMSLGPRSVSDRSDLSEVITLLDWLWPSSDSEINIDILPDFSKVLAQLVAHFGLAI